MAGSVNTIAWLGERDDDSSSSQHPIDSSGSSSPSPVLSQFNPTHLMPNNPPIHGLDLNFGDVLPDGAIVSAAQSRVGSPVAGEELTLFEKRFGLSMSLAIHGMRGLAGSGSSGDETEELFGGDSEEMGETLVKMEEGDFSNGGMSVGGFETGIKKKGKRMPAKNLLAERRRRKKLNDKLYQLRSVVPNISRMDRVSILGDAIEYMQELTRKINHLQNELEPIPSPVTSPTSSSVTHATSFHPQTPTHPNSAPRIKKELFPSSLPSPNGQPARIEVRMKGRGMSIHMFCSKKPGLLLAISRALDSVGFEVQKAVVSSFNGFVMDIYRAEQCMEGQDVQPEQIKTLLLEAAGFAA